MDTTKNNGFSNVADLLGAALDLPTVASLEAPVVQSQDTAVVPTGLGGSPSLKLVKQEIGEWFGKAFDQICGCCPRWRYSLPTDDMVKNARVVWIQAMAEAGVIRKDQVNAGIKRLAASGREYLPTVADFIAMCKDTGEVSKWPTLDTAKKEILLGMTKGVADRKWSCRFVAELARRSGSIFHPTTHKDLRDIAFEAEYLAVVELAESGFFDREERVQVEHKTDPNLAYYFTLVRDFKHMPQLAEDHLKACADKGIIIDPVAGTVTRADISLVTDKVVTTKEYREYSFTPEGKPFMGEGMDSPNKCDSSASVGQGFTAKKNGVNSSGAVVLSGAEQELLALVVKNPLGVSAIYRDAALVPVDKLDGLAAYAGQVKALRNYIAVADLG
ncbi:MAG: hypothetical protein BWK73_09160 [Thiothrix lacustris]|uniref:Uncharacterized protein n=1 Tax=Thiothrix lacustris TaxID=525917 RepID=A0A1Y1QV48_9GAMM|nr:MAG: hypothetical protein BWK73_09160 [Thiothrix lacustris]